MAFDKDIILDRYRIVEKLGEGGMAVVYKALDEKLNRFVAIKIISPDKSISENFSRRFTTEAKALAQLNHPNIIPIYQYGTEGDTQYIVMEYLAGGTLKEKLGKALKIQEAAHVLAPIAQAIEHAHKSHIVHRDIKPSNILLTAKGEPILTDFGIAKVLQSEETVDTTGTGVVGTPFYMSPEQGLGRKIDERSDIYSLGVVFFELVTGQLPFTGENPIDVLVKQNKGEINLPAGVARKIPAYVMQVFRLTLAPAPENRFSSISEFRAILETLAQGKKPVFTAEQKRKSLAGTKKKRSQLAMPVGFGLIVVLGAGFWGFNALSQREVPPPESTASIAAVVQVSPTAQNTLEPRHTATFTPEPTQATETISTATATIEASMGPIALSQENIASITILETIPGVNDRKQVEFSPNGERAVVLYNNKTATLVTFSGTGNAVELMDDKGTQVRIDKVLFSPQGNFIAGLTDYKDVYLWDGETGNHIYTFAGTSQSIAFSAADSYLAIGYYQDYTVKVFNLDNCKGYVDQCSTLTGNYLQKNPIESIAFSPKEDTIFVKTSRSLNIWRVLDGAQLSTLEGETYIGNRGLWIPTAGNAFYLGGMLLNLGDQSIIADILPDPQGLVPITNSPDGEMIAVGSGSGFAIQSASDGSLLFSGAEGSSVITGIHFTQDGLNLLVSYQDGTIEKWGISGE